MQQAGQISYLDQNDAHEQSLGQCDGSLPGPRHTLNPINHLQASLTSTSATRALSAMQQQPWCIQKALHSTIALKAIRATSYKCLKAHWMPSRGNYQLEVHILRSVFQDCCNGLPTIWARCASILSHTSELLEPLHVLLYNRSIQTEQIAMLARCQDVACPQWY